VKTGALGAGGTGSYARPRCDSSCEPTRGPGAKWRVSGDGVELLTSGLDLCGAGLLTPGLGRSSVCG